jgi:hypothetical protein
LEPIFIDAHYPDAAIPGRLMPAVLTLSPIEGMLLETAILGVGVALLELAIKARCPARVRDSICVMAETIEIKPTPSINRAIAMLAVLVLTRIKRSCWTISSSR